MPADFNPDVASIKEWLAKEQHLPNDLSDLLIRKFLHSCYGSLEKTKKCIERFTAARTRMSEIYTSRDPLAPNLQTCFSVTSVTTYKAGENEILIHQYDDPTLEHLVFYDLLKAMTMHADLWLYGQDFLAEGHIIIMDIRDYSLRMLPKCNIMYFREFILYLLEGMPVRVKEVHLVNCPAVFEKLYALVKPILPSEIKRIIHAHQNVEALHKHIDKKYLPKDFGGDEPDMKSVHRQWLKKMEEDRDIFLNDSLWKSDLKKKLKNSIESTMHGSFKTLSID